MLTDKLRKNFFLANKVVAAVKKRLLSFGFLVALGLANEVLASEPTLNQILQGIDNTSWSQANWGTFASAGWNEAGTKMDFTLASENTSWAPWQTFGITDGKSKALIFSGTDTNGAHLTYTLQNSFKKYVFDETNPQQSFGKDDTKLFVSSNGVYVFAHEDWKDNDYNDMVVSLRVTVPMIPEPASYMMLLVGFVAVAFVSRKRNPSYY